MGEPHYSSKRPQYLMRAWSNSNEGEKGEFFILHIRLHGKSFAIHVLLERFKASPIRTQEFYTRLEFLQAGGCDDEYEDKEMDEHDDVDGGGDTGVRRVTLAECFDWAVSPCLHLFEGLAPLPLDVPKPTLQLFYGLESFECELGAEADKLIPGPIERHHREDYLRPPPGEEYIPWKTTFPSYHTSDVEVLHDETEDLFLIEPRRVLVGSRLFFFKATDDPGDTLGQNEVERYEQIAKANFGPEVHTSRLYGVVRNECQELVGFLLHYIDVDATLVDTVTRNPSQSSKERWSTQIRDTVQALHGVGIVWGNATALNILIDRNGDAWVVDFRGGYTSNWVDPDKAGTFEGDLQGLRKILAFISSGVREYDDNIKDA